jgi:Holliday junction resolvase RusA-like endonuclease
LKGPVKVTLHLFYRTQLPDLDESIVLDVMQDRYAGKGESRAIVQKGIYRNDRQVREKHVYHGIDKRNPRAEIEIETLVLQQEALVLADVSQGTLAEEEKEPF